MAVFTVLVCCLLYENVSGNKMIKLKQHLNCCRSLKCGNKVYISLSRPFLFGSVHARKYFRLPFSRPVLMAEYTCPVWVYVDL